MKKEQSLNNFKGGQLGDSLKHGSLFSGIGGFDLAAQWMGWENVFHCEWNEFGQKILQHYWPKAITYEDITKTDFSIHRGKIDILTGGFPCQPYSVAGKRKGKEDERHLWPEMLRAIKEIAPSYVVGENVYGIVNWNDGLVFNEVQIDLENEGYEVQPFILPAASVNAPHKRDRVWFIAYSNDNRKSGRTGKDAGESKKERLQERNEIQQPNESDGLRKFSTNSKSQGSRRKYKQQQEQREFRGQNCGNDVTNTKRSGGLQVLQKLQREQSNGQSSYSFDEPGNWEKFPTQAPICDGDDGISSRLDAITFPKWRSESVKGGGNAIVPQVAFKIFKALMETEAKERGQNYLNGTLAETQL